MPSPTPAIDAIAHRESASVLAGRHSHPAEFVATVPWAEPGTNHVALDAAFVRLGAHGHAVCVAILAGQSGH